MEKFQELKEINLEPQYKQLFIKIDEADTFLPEKIIKQQLNQVGFYSTDDTTYKCINLLAEKLLTSVVEDVIKIDKKNNKNQKESQEEQPPQNEGKKQKTLGKRTFTLRQLTQAFEEKGLPIFKAPYYPESELIKKFIKKTNSINQNN